MCHIAPAWGRDACCLDLPPRFWRMDTLTLSVSAPKPVPMPPLGIEVESRMNHQIKVERGTPGGPGCQRVENKHPVGGAIAHVIRSTYSIILLQFTYKTQIHGKKSLYISR